jgi:hypothetical protein
LTFAAIYVPCLFVDATSPFNTAPGEREGMIAEQADRCQQALEALSEIGMDLAQTLRRDVVAGPAAAREPETTADAEPTETAAARAARSRALRWGDPALAFSRLSRSIRLTFALEARVVRGENIGAAPGRAGPAAAAPDDDDDEYDWRPTPQEAEIVRLGAYKKLVRRVVGDAIEAEPVEGAERERLIEALDERLAETEDDEFLISLPLGEFINRFRQAIGLVALDEPWNETERSKFRAELAEHRAKCEAGLFRVGPPREPWRPGMWRPGMPIFGPTRSSACAGTSIGCPPGPGP